MATEHWFDVVSKNTLRSTTRRKIVRSVAVFLPGLLLGGLAESVTAGKKRQGKKSQGKKKGQGPKNDKGKDKKPGKPDICAKNWLGNGLEAQNNRESCRETRKRCKRPGHGPFCIVDYLDPEDKYADCCKEGESCCNGGCVDLKNNDLTCGTSCKEAKACRLDEHCVNGTCQRNCAAGARRGSGRAAADEACPCEGPECVCYDRNCPPALGCVDDDGYLCNGAATNGCRCQCGPGLKLCPNAPVGPACVSENSTFC